MQVEKAIYVVVHDTLIQNKIILCNKFYFVKGKYKHCSRKLTK